MTSVVIAAHNEESVIGRCLQALADQADIDDLDVIVVANGCSDATADVARSHGVRVVELTEPGKSGALVAGDAAAVGFPRIYLDADIELPAHAVVAVEQTFADDPGALAAAPRRRITTAGCALPVRAYFAINQRLPAFHEGLFGRGVIALSREGRRAFDTFPVVIADDLFLDSLFTAEHKRRIASVEILVAAPRRTLPLLRRLVRVRRGNAELRAALRRRGRGSTGQPAGPVGVRRTDRSAWLTQVVLHDPRLLPAGVVYAGLTLVAAALSRRPTGFGQGWGRDDTTRSSEPPRV